VLFSRPEVREILKDVLLAWESVRPVPTATIDFGNGRTLKRTINGNIAFYVCAPDGRVVDILPGLSSPEAFVRDLREALDRIGAVPGAAHRSDGARPSRAIPADAAKIMAVEAPLHRELVTEADFLDADTRHNRAERKPKVRALLAGASVRPAEITKRVYKEILGCDLDDPYLGLAGTLFDGGGYGGR
jgi:hypothetical protein